MQPGKLYTLIFVVFSTLTLYSYTLAAGERMRVAPASEKMYGVTLTSVTRLEQTIVSLQKLPQKPTARIVFDPWVAPQFYNDAIFQINKVSYIMGELVDSYNFNDYDLKNYKERINAYLNYYPAKVDIWEIGNEVNGEWLGSTKSVIEKLKNGYDLVKLRNQKVAVTFFYNNGCYEDADHEMFTWIKNSVPDKMKKGLDYVFVSYYDEECSFGEPDWQYVFDELHKTFPNAKIGIGECGVKDREYSEDYIKKCYQINVTTPNFIGGYFWWYFKRDCVPYTKPTWTVLSDAMKLSMTGGK